MDLNLSEHCEWLTECVKDGTEGIGKWNVWRQKNDEVLLEGWKSTPGQNMQNIDLHGAYLKSAKFVGAYLNDAKFNYANIEDVKFDQSHLQDTHFTGAEVDGKTSFWGCKVSKYKKRKKGSDFDGVALDRVHIEPGVRQILEYNIRRKYWEEWYKRNKIKGSMVRLFWSISDYGISTGRIVLWFFGLAVIFAMLYGAIGSVDYFIFKNREQPGVIKNLFVGEDAQGAVGRFALEGEGFPLVLDIEEDKKDLFACWIVGARSFYFSIVTMTTLGFGDMHAKEGSLLGYFLLTLQVVIGYVLLGAIITRFAILFTSGGPDTTNQ